MEERTDIKTSQKNFLKEIPNSPGVYIFRNINGEIIYIGRAASLKNRVSSYFRKNTLNPRPIERLMSEVDSVGFQKTSNLLEAAVLENNLIKKHMPEYNVRDKDNRSFVYLFFNMNDDFPRPVIIRGRELGRYSPSNGSVGDRKEIIGPFQSYHLLKKIILVARRLFPYSTCVPNSGRPCFHNQIGLCPGACVGAIEPKEYKRTVRKMIRFLRSLDPKTGEKNINDAILIPEEAILGDSRFTRIEGYDISHFQRGETYGSMVVFEEIGRASCRERV